MTTRNNLARLNADGSVDSAFNPNPNSFVRNITWEPDGRILIGGGFTALAPNGGVTVLRKYIARLNLDGTVDLRINANPNDQVFAIAVQPDNKIVGGGVLLSSNSFMGQTRNRLARLEVDGRLDQTLNLNAVGGGVRASAVQADGKILIGGDFTSILGTQRNNMARLNTDGTLDTTFNPVVNDAVDALAVQADGKILVGGYFSAIGPNGGASVPRNRIARLNADGTMDTAFDPNAGDGISSIAVQADGKILIGGAFTTLKPNGGAIVPRGLLARLNANGTVDSTFNPMPNLDVYAIAIQEDGKILIGGSFTNVSSKLSNIIRRGADPR